MVTVMAPASERSTSWPIWVLLFCVLTVLSAAAAVTASSSGQFIQADEYIHLQKNAASVQKARSSNRTILAYITPWNSKGTHMVDEFSDKIDLVSPVWYTILVSQPLDVTSAKSKRERDGADARYVLSGGPPNPHEEAWLKRQLDQDSRRLKIVPRFYLDDWQQHDYVNLLSNPGNWDRLAEVITQEVEKRNFDGVVFESAATHLLFEPIHTLATSLKALSVNKSTSLTVVLPPLRTTYSLGGGRVDHMQESQNRMIVQSIPQMAQVVDYFSIMTYDMSSAAGRVSGASGKDFPNDSPLRGAKKESLRHPGPNTSPKWIKENLQMIEEAVRAAARAKLARMKQETEREEDEGTQDEVDKLKDPSNPFLYSDFSATEELDEDQETKREEEEEQDELALIRGKLLMGMPMYGYRYPVFWVDKSTGQGVSVPPPTDAAQAQALVSRTESASPSILLPFLRGPGEAVTMDAIISILTDNDGVIVDAKHGDGEGWFDYTETITNEHTNGRESHGVKEGDQIYWRLYLPLPSTTRSRLSALDQVSELRAGVSLWELGQARPLLLQDL